MEVLNCSHCYLDVQSRLVTHEVQHSVSQCPVSQPVRNPQARAETATHTTPRLLWTQLASQLHCLYNNCRVHSAHRRGGLAHRHSSSVQYSTLQYTSSKAPNLAHCVTRHRQAASAESGQNLGKNCMHSVKSLNQQVNAAALSTSQYMCMLVTPAHLTSPQTNLCLVQHKWCMHSRRVVQTLASPRTQLATCGIATGDSTP